MIFAAVALTATITVTGGTSQTGVRKVLTYSSLNNVSWMVVRETARRYAWGIYFVTYCFLIGPLVRTLIAVGCSYRGQILTGGAGRQDTILVLFRLFSLGGLPPLLGFLNKLLVVKSLVPIGGLLMLSVVVLASLVLLYFYTSLAFFTLRFSPSAYGPSSKSPYMTWAKAMAGFPLVALFLFSRRGVA